MKPAALRHPRDWQSLAYLAAQPLLMAWQCLLEPSLSGYVMRVFLLGALRPSLRTRSLRDAAHHPSPASGH